MKGAIGITLIAIILTASIVYAGFGEIGGVLNFALYPNSSQTLQWGLINDGNQSLSFTIMNKSSDFRLQAQNNLSINATPDITFYSSSWSIPPDTTEYVNVTVSSQGLKVGQKWHGLIQALATPSGNSSSGANIQLGTVKMFNINIVQTTTTTSTSTTTIPTTVSPIVPPQLNVQFETLLIIVVAAVVVIVIVYYLILRKHTKKTNVEENRKKTTKRK
ncbi:MAG: hypothetical protein ABSD68_00055 [Candidatus Micrarchaeales archaeon]|jgi:hypothetical protein